jgi:hypothetical protein
MFAARALLLPAVLAVVASAIATAAQTGDY